MFAVKTFILRACVKIGRFFWSWGFLKFILWTITLTVLLYAEEDWRGARAWALTKAKWEARGESFDRETYYPRPVPDDQNLAALSIFALEKDPAENDAIVPLKLRAALNEDFHGGQLPNGRVTPNELRLAVAAAYVRTFPGPTPPASIVAQFEALYPIIPQLRRAIMERPYCRFNSDYNSQPAWSRGFALVVSQIPLAKKIAMEGKLAVAENQPQLALDDIKLNFRLAYGVGRDPTLVAGLVAIGLTAINRQIIDEGVKQRIWNDAQLAGLQRDLARIDFLAQYQFTLRGETITQIVSNYDTIKAQRPSILRDWLGMIDTKTGTKKQMAVSMYSFWPGGWLDQNKAKAADFLFRKAEAADPKVHRVFPEVTRELQREVDRAMELPWRLAPWNILFAVSESTFTNLASKFAEIQAWLDEDRIACGLERYRLAHGTYPETLDVLAPAFIDVLPHDITSGEMYRYHLRPDGTFLLYSVGWNARDDGGEIAYEKDTPNQVDYLEGDWPWPYSQSRPR
jgi:hypothetical protein